MIQETTYHVIGLEKNLTKESLYQIEAKLTKREQQTNFQRDVQVLSFLEMFRPETHSIEIRPGDRRDYMVREKLIEWIPPIFGSNNQYAITDHGLKHRDILRNDIELYKRSQKS